MSVAMVKNVAKKKTKPAGQSPRKPMIVQLRGSEEFKAWAEGLAELDGRSLAGLVNRALIAYAKEIGYTKEPPKR